MRPSTYAHMLTMTRRSQLVNRALESGARCGGARGSAAPRDRSGFRHAGATLSVARGLFASPAELFFVEGGPMHDTSVSPRVPIRDDFALSGLRVLLVEDDPEN